MAIDVTTLQRAKVTLNKKQDDIGEDDLILGLIAETSRQIEHYIQTDLELVARTEVHDIDRFQREFILWNAPIASIASVKSRSSLTTSWASVSAMDSGAYDFAANTGRLVIDSVSLFGGSLALQVVYTAGFAATTSALVTNYLDIVSAAETQIRYAYGRKKQPEQSSHSVAGGVAFRQSELQLLTAVQQTLAKHRRVFLA